MIRRIRAFGSSRPRLRILGWALLLAMICGLLEAAEPIEDMVKATRDLARARPASGQFVVVKVDERTARALGTLSFSRRHDAALLDRLFAMGARRVFLDRVYADRTSPAEDRAFADALRRHRGRVFLGAIGSSGGDLEELVPLPEFRKIADYRGINGRPQPFSLGASLPFAVAIDGAMVPSMAAEMAGHAPASDAHFRPDWSVRIASIPDFSFSDVLAGAVPRDRIAGRDVIVGWTAATLRDIHRVPFQGLQPGVFFHVVGAETLLQGTPARLGWPPLVLAAFPLAGLYLLSRRWLTRGLAMALAIGLIGPLPFVLDMHLIEVDVLPALLFLAVTGYQGTSLKRLETTRRSHPASALPNLVALMEEPDQPGTLVALKIRNFPQIAASFTTSVEGSLFREVERRIRVAGNTGPVYHGEDALFWFEREPLSHELINHIGGLHKLLTQPLRIEDRDVDLLVSFGIDVDRDRPMPSRVASATLCAEEAAQANDLWKVYDAQRLDKAAWELSLMGRLSAALANGEVWVAYQPKVDLATRQIIGAEALARWHHPTAGFIPPDQFIPAAEAHNRIADLTYFILRRALEDLAELRRRGHDGLGIAVNLSPRMLLDPAIVGEVVRLLAANGLPRDALTLEVTETIDFLSSPAKVRTMEELARTGVRISIDDYGTGSATLEYLSRLPSQEVKIDRTFISNLDTDAQNMILVRSTLEMAHKLGRKVVAEGVENEPVMQVLKQLGCDVAQGYLLGKPVPFAQLTEMLDGDLPLAQRRLVIW